MARGCFPRGCHGLCYPHLVNCAKRANRKRREQNISVEGKPCVQYCEKKIEYPDTTPAQAFIWPHQCPALVVLHRHSSQAALGSLLWQVSCAYEVVREADTTVQRSEWVYHESYSGIRMDPPRSGLR